MTTPIRFRKGDEVLFNSIKCKVIHRDKANLLTLRSPENVVYENVESADVHFYGEPARKSFFRSGIWYKSSAEFGLIPNAVPRRLLEFLINFHYTYAHKKEWFFATTGFIKSLTFMSMKTIEAAFRSLRKFGLVSTKIGQSRKRYVRINFDAIVAFIEEKKKQWIKDNPDYSSRWEEATVISCNGRALWATNMPYDEYLQTEHWRTTRSKALKRAQMRCQLCNSKKKLHVHHRTYERLGRELQSDLIALCKACHEKFHDIQPEVV